MFKFNFVINKDKNVVIKDVSMMSDKFPPKIESMVMSISSAGIPEGVVENLDIVEYMRLHRVNNELYIIKPETLGLNAGSNILDGTYRVTIKINNTLEYKDTFVYLDELAGKITVLMDSIDTDIDIEDNTIFTDNIPYDVKHSKIYYIIAVYFKLLTLLRDNSKVAEVNDLIDKLQRLLLIVT